MVEVQPHVVDHLEDVVGAVSRHPIRHIENLPSVAVLLVLEEQGQTPQEMCKEQLIVLAVEQHLVVTTIATICIYLINLANFLGAMVVSSLLGGSTRASV